MAVSQLGEADMAGTAGVLGAISPEPSPLLLGTVRSQGAEGPEDDRAEAWELRVLRTPQGAAAKVSRRLRFPGRGLRLACGHHTGSGRLCRKLRVCLSIQ